MPKYLGDQIAIKTVRGTCIRDRRSTKIVESNI